MQIKLLTKGEVAAQLRVSERQVELMVRSRRLPHGVRMGKQVFWGMLPVGDGRYEGGRLWSPKRDKEFNARLTLTGQTLVVEGCVMTICQVGGRWQRVN